MATIIKSLGDAQLVSTSQPSYEYLVPSTRTAVVRSIRLTNADATVPATVQVECQSGTTARDTNFPNPAGSRKAAPVSLLIPPNGSYAVTEEMTLAAGDRIRVVLMPPGSGTAMLDVVMSGIERDI